jgi:hypothetical protein
VSSGVGDRKSSGAALANGTLWGSGDDKSIASIPGDDGVGGIVDVALHLEPLKTLFRVTNNDLLGVGKPGLCISSASQNKV